MGYELAMNVRNRSRSRILSAQKPLRRRKQRVKGGAGRKKIDLMELHRSVVETGKRRKRGNLTWIKVVVFLIAVPGFFLLGCWIAALSVSPSMKAFIAFPVAALGIILSYVVASSLR